ncbi:hypothetical protein MSG28_008096 [Choristoneura fumiferana]|uniref:Uncharacterized protein n=1 Tax=Choristoneura fumiferana TaxID=7141 RepID=A0ACC0J9X7_CHOFU|nr:hypothetical protein MSG28_008096 [Choristoneura fumiferana]
MDDETFGSHLNTLKEMLLDEEKLVTYVSISKELCIHVNESKSLMNKVVQDIRKIQPDTKLNINYVISGLAEDSKAYTYVCSDNDIADYRLIKSTLCSKRTAEEIGNLKSHSVVADEKPIKPPVKKVKEEKANDVNMNGHGDTKKVFEVKSEPIKQEKTSPQKDSATNNKQKPVVKNANKPQKGISGFFSRSESTSAKKTTKDIKSADMEINVKSEKKDTNIHNNVEKMDVDEKIENEPKETKVDKKEEKTSANKNKETNGASKNKAKNHNKSLTQIKKNAKVDKKRKRVLCVSDSDSDEEKNDPFVDEDDAHNQQMNIDSEDEIPPTPAVNTIKVTSALLNPKKRRKIVNKTYTDEEGYILTRKEEVYESLSENEDITETKENIKTDIQKVDEVSPKKSESKAEVSPKGKKTGTRNSKKKISPPQKGKQASIMSFFNKK